MSGDVKTLVFKVIGHGSTIQAGPMGSSCVVVAGTDSSLAGRALRMVVLLAPAANSKRQINSSEYNKMETLRNQSRANLKTTDHAGVVTK